MIVLVLIDDYHHTRRVDENIKRRKVGALKFSGGEVTARAKFQIPLPPMTRQQFYSLSIQ